MISSDLSLQLHHQRHDEFVRAAARSALVREARPSRSPRVRPSRLSVLDAVTRTWQRLIESRPMASATDPAVCCA